MIAAATSRAIASVGLSAIRLSDWKSGRLKNQCTLPNGSPVTVFLWAFVFG